MVLPRSRFANLAIEGELAVELSRAPRSSDFSGLDMPACVARVLPVIELHHHVMRGERPSAGELIANNAIHAGFIAGSGARPRHVREEPALSIHADDQLVEECSGQVLIRTIATSLKWLIGMLRDRGDSLGAGQIILTGSIPRLLRVDRSCRITVDAPPFGSVDAEFT